MEICLGKSALIFYIAILEQFNMKNEVRSVAGKILIFILLLCGLLLGQADKSAQTEFFLINLIEISKDRFVVGQSPEDIDFQPIIRAWADKVKRTEKELTAEIQQWVETAGMGDDPFKVGLALFYQKQFMEAAEAFREAVSRKSERLAEAKDAGKLEDEETQKLLMAATRDTRLTGHSLYHAYDFNNAVLSYQRALSYISKEKHPGLWAATLFDIGQIYSDVGTKTKPPENMVILSNSIKAFNAALEIYTMEKNPEKWANTNNRLGAVLAILGLNLNKQNSDSLITAATDAMKNALKVVTFETAPQQWAKIQNNLGATLSEHGYKKGEEGKDLVKASIVAYKNALKVRTRKINEQVWARMQNNLAEAYFFVADWPNVASSYANVLEVFPEDETAYFSSVNIYQTEIFNFTAAYKMSEKWLQTHPDDLIEKIKFTEKCLTTGKYQAAQGHIDTFIENKDYSDFLQILMQTLDVGNHIALKKNSGLIEKIDGLIQKIQDQRGDFQLNYNYAGLVYYAENTAMLAPQQQWLADFFRAVSKVDRDLIAEELKKVRATL